MKRKKNNFRYSKNKNRLTAKQIMLLLPILFTVGLLPLMVRFYTYYPGLSKFAWYYGGEEALFGDVFLFYRQWWFTGITFYMLFVLIIKFILDKKSLKFSITILPLGVYAFLSFLSSILSDYKQYCFGGIFEQFENVFVLLGYALIVYYSFIIINDEKEITLIINVLTGSTLILGAIGTAQTLHFDFFRTEFAAELLVPSNSPYGLNVVQNSAYMTLYNPNYVGVYVAMLLPFYLVLLVFAKSWIQRIVYCITSILLLISLYGSGSKAAFLVIAGEMFLLLIFLRKPIIKLWYLIIPGATALVCTFLLINQYRDNAYINRIVQALQIHQTEYSLQEMTTEEDGVHIKYNNNTLIVSMDVENDFLHMQFRDKENNSILYETNDNNSQFTLIDDRFKDISITYGSFNELLCFGVKIDNHTWFFTNQATEDGTYYYYTTKGKLDRMIMAEQVLFNDYEKIFSGRGYIWSTSIPLLLDHLFLGSGADTYVLEFPQQDYLRLWRNGYSTQVLSKPHSLYLQVGVQTGVISLLALIAFFCIYIIQGIRLYIKTKFESIYEQLGVAILIAVVGFAVMGISNDSSVTVSPVFWAIAGLGVAINSKYKEKKKEQ